MAIQVFKISSVDILCPVLLREQINADPLFTAVCIDIRVDNFTDMTFDFDIALTTAEDTQLDLLILNIDCATLDDEFGSGAGIDVASGISILNDDIPLVDDVSALNFKGSVAPIDQGDQVDLYIGTVEITNGDSVTILNRQPVYSMGFNSITGQVIVGLADASDPNKMPAIGIIVNGDIIAGGNGLVTTTGEAKGLDTSGFTVGDKIYVAPGGGDTNIKPIGAGNLIQKVCQIIRVDAINGTTLVIGAGRHNDIPNLADGKVWMGDTNDVPQPTTIKVDDLITGTPVSGDTVIFDGTNWIAQPPSGSVIGISHQLMFGEQYEAKNEWLELFGDSRFSNQTFGVMPLKSKLVGITFSNRYNDRDTEVRIYSTPEGAAVSPKTLDFSWLLNNTRTARKTNFPTDIIFDAGDKIGVYLADKGSEPYDVSVVLYFIAIDAVTGENIDNVSGNYAAGTGGGSS